MFLVFLFLLLIPASGLFSQEDVSGYLEDLSESSGTDVWERLEDLKIDPIPINKAKEQDLLQIPWIDPSLAGKIIGLREKKGRFAALGELLEVKGMTHELYLQVIPYLKIEQVAKTVIRLDMQKKAGSDDVRVRLSSSGSNYTTGIKAAGYREKENSVSGYLLIRVPGFFKAPGFRAVSLLAGDMYNRLGQGLVSWSAFGGLRSPERPVVYPLAGGGVRGTTSSSGKNVQRGIALTFPGESFQLVLSSGVLGDGRIRKRFSTISCAVEQFQWLRYQGYFLSPGDGNFYLAGMFEFDFEAGMGFGEVVHRSPEGNGVLFGLQKTSSGVSLLLLYRRLSHRYSTGLGFDMTLHGSSVGNVEAFYTGLVIGRGRGVECAFYRDLGRRIYVGEAYTPIRFDDCAISLKLHPVRRFTSHCSLLFEEDELLDVTSTRERHWRFRWDLILKPAPGLTLKHRAQFSRGLDGGERWQSSLSYAEADASVSHGFDVRVRFTWYNCSDGGHLYIVEGGLPERSLILRLSGEGERYHLVAVKRLGDSWSLRWKISKSVRRRNEYERGFDFETWEKELSFEFQCEYRF